MRNDGSTGSNNGAAVNPGGESSAKCHKEASGVCQPGTSGSHRAQHLKHYAEQNGQGSERSPVDLGSKFRAIPGANFGLSLDISHGLSPSSGRPISSLRQLPKEPPRRAELALDGSLSPNISHGAVGGLKPQRVANGFPVNRGETSLSRNEHVRKLETLRVSVDTDHLIKEAVDFIVAQGPLLDLYKPDLLTRFSAGMKERSFFASLLQNETTINDWTSVGLSCAQTEIRTLNLSQTLRLYQLVASSGRTSRAASSNPCHQQHCNFRYALQQHLCDQFFFQLFAPTRLHRTLPCTPTARLRSNLSANLNSDTSKNASSSQTLQPTRFKAKLDPSEAARGTLPGLSGVAHDDTKWSVTSANLAERRDLSREIFLAIALIRRLVGGSNEENQANLLETRYDEIFCHAPTPAPTRSVSAGGVPPHEKSGSDKLRGERIRSEFGRTSGLSEESPQARTRRHRQRGFWWRVFLPKELRTELDDLDHTIERGNSERGPQNESKPKRDLNPAESGQPELLFAAGGDAGPGVGKRVKGAGRGAGLPEERGQMGEFKIGAAKEQLRMDEEKNERTSPQRESMERSSRDRGYRCQNYLQLARSALRPARRSPTVHSPNLQGAGGEDPQQPQSAVAHDLMVSDSPTPNERGRHVQPDDLKNKKGDGGSGREGAPPQISENNISNSAKLSDKASQSGSSHQIDLSVPPSPATACLGSWIKRGFSQSNNVCRGSVTRKGYQVFFHFPSFTASSVRPNGLSVLTHVPQVPLSALPTPTSVCTTTNWYIFEFEPQAQSLDLLHPNDNWNACIQELSLRLAQRPSQASETPMQLTPLPLTRPTTSPAAVNDPKRPPHIKQITPLQKFQFPTNLPLESEGINDTQKDRQEDRHEDRHEDKQEDQQEDGRGPTYVRKEVLHIPRKTYTSGRPDPPASVPLPSLPEIAARNPSPTRSCPITFTAPAPSRVAPPIGPEPPGSQEADMMSTGRTSDHMTAEPSAASLAVATGAAAGTSAAASRSAAAAATEESELLPKASALSSEGSMVSNLIPIEMHGSNDSVFGSPNSTRDIAALEMSPLEAHTAQNIDLDTKHGEPSLSELLACVEEEAGEMTGPLARADDKQAPAPSALKRDSEKASHKLTLEASFAPIVSSTASTRSSVPLSPALQTADDARSQAIGVLKWERSEASGNRRVRTPLKSVSGDSDRKGVDGEVKPGESPMGNFFLAMRGALTASRRRRLNRSFTKQPLTNQSLTGQSLMSQGRTFPADWPDSVRNCKEADCVQTIRRPSTDSREFRIAVPPGSTEALSANPGFFRVNNALGLSRRGSSITKGHDEADRRGKMAPQRNGQGSTSKELDKKKLIHSVSSPVDLELMRPFVAASAAPPSLSRSKMVLLVSTSTKSAATSAPQTPAEKSQHEALLPISDCATRNVWNDFSKDASPPISHRSPSQVPSQAPSEAASQIHSQTTRQGGSVASAVPGPEGRAIAKVNAKVNGPANAKANAKAKSKSKSKSKEKARRPAQENSEPINQIGSSTKKAEEKRFPEVGLPAADFSPKKEASASRRGPAHPGTNDADKNATFLRVGDSRLELSKGAVLNRHTDSTAEDRQNFFRIRRNVGR